MNSPSNSDSSRCQIKPSKSKKEGGKAEKEAERLQREMLQAASREGAKAAMERKIEVVRATIPLSDFSNHSGPIALGNPLPESELDGVASPASPPPAPPSIHSPLSVRYRPSTDASRPSSHNVLAPFATKTLSVAEWEAATGRFEAESETREVRRKAKLASAKELQLEEWRKRQAAWIPGVPSGKGRLPRPPRPTAGVKERPLIKSLFRKLAVSYNYSRTPSRV